MHDGIPYGRNQGQGQGHSREVDRQSPTGLIFTACCAVQFIPEFVSEIHVWQVKSVYICESYGKN